ncbi:MAG: DUF4326 domain-containing protein [Mycobacterium sp.]
MSDDPSAPRATSVSWPVAVDERLRLLVRLAAHEGEQSGRLPSATVVLQNLILGQPLTGVAHLGKKPTAELLKKVAEDNRSFSWLDREPFLGRPRKRSYAVPRPVVLKRGVRLPKNAVSVARPSKFGNPWKVSPTEGKWRVEGEFYAREFESRIGAHTAAVELYSRWLNGDPSLHSANLDQRRSQIEAALAGLQDKDLACYCPLDLPCHRDVLLKLVNGIPGEQEPSVMTVGASAGVRIAEQWAGQVHAEVGATNWENYPVEVRRALVAKAALEQLADIEGSIDTETIRSVMGGINAVILKPGGY